MIAGLATHAGLQERPYSAGFICTDEKIEAAQRRPVLYEQRIIEDYRLKYKEAMGRWPHGLHYIPFPHEAETVPIWFGPQS